MERSEDGGGMIVEKTKVRSLKRIALDGMLLNVFNPTFFVFLAFLPQFMPANVVNTIFMLSYLALIFMIWHLLYLLFMALLQPPHAINFYNGYA